MNTILIRIFAFFLGLFIALIIISFNKINEPFTNISLPESLNPLSNRIVNYIDNIIDNSIIDNNDDSIIPYKGYKFMCINTYNNLSNISVTDGRWYEIDNKSNNVYYNYNNYFKFNKIINLEHNNLNSKIGVKGANINSIELLGPSCFNFANNSETYELVEFTMFMTVKFISFLNKNNIIFEMTGNTTTINILEPNYTTSIININIVLNDNKKYDIILLIGDKIYKGLANNIDKDIIENTNYITIGLYYTKEKIGLIFNDKIYEYANINTNIITLGSTPLIINKNGSINMSLYNFVYYKNLFNFADYDYYIRFNNYYISGLFAKECINKEEKKIEEDKKQPINDNIDNNNDKIILPNFEYPILKNNFYYYNYDDNTIINTPNILKKIFGF